MDPIKLEKLRAMNEYKRAHSLQVLFQYCLTAFALSLLFSNSIWFNSLVSCVNAFFLVTLPNIGSYLTQPKFVFVVCNVIVMILVGESKLVSPNSSSPASEIYDEYVRRNRSQQRRLSSTEIKEELKSEDLHVRKGEAVSVEENGRDRGEEKGNEEEEEPKEEEEEKEVKEEEEEEEEKEEEKEKEEEDNNDDDEEKEVDKLGEEDDNGLPTAELNKRIEAFFAKVIEQRRMEAQMLVSAG